MEMYRMNHLAQIASKLPEYGLDAMLITSAPGEFYAVGFRGEGVALVTPKQSWYYTDSRYIEAAAQQVTGAKVSLPERGVSYRATVQALVEQNGIQKLGFEDEYMSVREFDGWSEALSPQLVPSSKLLAELRMVKDETELAAMREAQRITDAAFSEIVDYIQPGMTEQEVAARLQYIMLRMGAERMSFDPIVAAGANGSKPHAVPGQARIGQGQFVTMDFGCVYQGYCSDMTRTIAVGRPTEEMERVYHIVLEAQLAGIEVARGGISGAQVHAAGADVIAKAGYGAYFGHGFGHSLGIEIHESPRFSPTWDRSVPCGAVLSAEPGIYLPGRFGVRIEDVVILTETGCIDITKSSKDLIVLEK
jgi:Xaa-Pro aminopeptidase